MSAPEIKIADLRQGIAAIAPSERKRSKREVISEMIAEIDTALQRGVTLEQINAYLRGNGFDLGLNTLRQYVADARRNTAGKTTKPRKPRTPVTATATPQTPAFSQKSNPPEAPPRAVPGTDASKFVNVKDGDL